MPIQGDIKQLPIETRFYSDIENTICNTSQLFYEEYTSYLKDLAGAQPVQQSTGAGEEKKGASITHKQIALLQLWFQVLTSKNLEEDDISSPIEKYLTSQLELLFENNHKGIHA